VEEMRKDPERYNRRPRKLSYRGGTRKELFSYFTRKRILILSVGRRWRTRGSEAERRYFVIRGHQYKARIGKWGGGDTIVELRPHGWIIVKNKKKKKKKKNSLAYGRFDTWGAHFPITAGNRPKEKGIESCRKR